jgi:hypothetical protein
VGIAHTNYVEYARRDRGEVSAQFLKHLNAFVCALHCHKVVKLSDAVQPLPRQVRVRLSVRLPTAVAATFTAREGSLASPRMHATILSGSQTCTYALVGNFDESRV